MYLASCVSYTLVPCLVPGLLFSCSEDWLCNVSWLSKGGSLSCTSFDQRASGSPGEYRHKLRKSMQTHGGHYTKEIEWKDITWLTVKSGGLMRHTNLRQNPVPLGVQA